MTPKERVLAAISHKQPDRVPIQTYLTPEMYQQLADHFGATDVHGALGIDFRGVSARFTGAERPIPEDCACVDEWGTGYIMKEYPGGTYPESFHQPLAALSSLGDVEAYPWPTVDDYDFSVLRDQCAEVSDYAVCLGGAGIPDIVNGVGRGRGMEAVLLDIITQDPVGTAIIDKRCDYYYDYCRKALETAGNMIDILCLGEDCGNQNGPMFDPAVFDQFFRPRLQRFYDLGHEFGCAVMMHSCGSTRKLMPRFIEMGLDVLDAVQPEPAGMNPEELKKEFGGQLSFCGMISTQQTLPHGTEAECRAEARHRIEIIGKGGGYIFSPAHCIQPDTPLDNVLAIYEEALGLAEGALQNAHA